MVSYLETRADYFALYCGFCYRKSNAKYLTPLPEELWGYMVYSINQCSIGLQVAVIAVILMRNFKNSKFRLYCCEQMNCKVMGIDVFGENRIFVKRCTGCCIWCFICILCDIYRPDMFSWGRSSS